MSVQEKKKRWQESTVAKNIAKSPERKPEFPKVAVGQLQQDLRRDLGIQERTRVPFQPQIAQPSGKVHVLPLHEPSRLPVSSYSSQAEHTTKDYGLTVAKGCAFRVPFPLSASRIRPLHHS